jgi:hypothetical protein
MSAHVPRLAASAPTEQIVHDLQEHGAAIVEGVISPDLLARFNAELDPLLEKVSPDRRYLNPAIDQFYGDRVRQITGMAAQSRVFGEEILCHPFYGSLCDAILGPSCSSYQLIEGPEPTSSCCIATKRSGSICRSRIRRWSSPR